MPDTSSIDMPDTSSTAYTASDSFLLKCIRIPSTPVENKRLTLYNMVSPNPNDGSIISETLPTRQFVIVIIYKLLKAASHKSLSGWEDHPRNSNGVSIYLDKYIYDYRKDFFLIRDSLNGLLSNDLDIIRDIDSFLFKMANSGVVDTHRLTSTIKVESVIDAILGYTKSEDVDILNRVITIMDQSMQDLLSARLMFFHRKDQVFLHVPIFPEYFDMPGNMLPGCSGWLSQLKSSIFRDINRLDKLEHREILGLSENKPSISTMCIIVVTFLAYMEILGVSSKLTNIYVDSHVDVLGNVQVVNNKMMKRELDILVSSLTVLKTPKGSTLKCLLSKYAIKDVELASSSSDTVDDEWSVYI